MLHSHLLSARAMRLIGAAFDRSLVMILIGNDFCNPLAKAHHNIHIMHIFTRIAVAYFGERPRRVNPSNRMSGMAAAGISVSDWCNLGTVSSSGLLCLGKHPSAQQSPTAITIYTMLRTVIAPIVLAAKCTPEKNVDPLSTNCSWCGRQ